MQENTENNQQNQGDKVENSNQENLVSAENELQNKIIELEQKLSEQNDKFLRTLAELDNVRRRSREENEKTAKFAISNFVSDLVTVAENFFMASENAPKDEIIKNPAIKNYALAIEMTEK